MSAEARHIPVLLDEVLRELAPRPGAVLLDATLGLGGHAAAIVERLMPTGELLGMDRDELALELARKRLEALGGRIQLFHGPYSRMGEFLRSTGRAPEGALDGVLFDLGVSSFQIDTADRGFSILHDGPLDMRMDPSAGRSAADWLDEISVQELENVLRDYGEERAARRIARAIDRQRRKARITTTGQLANLVEAVLPRKGQRIHPATRTFQAIRIAVNEELEHLRLALRDLDRFLAPGGRVVVLSYHSLEDRVVKQSFAQGAREGLYRSPLPSLIRPTSVEVGRNPRARSARMRVAIRAGEV